MKKNFILYILLLQTSAFLFAQEVYTNDIFLDSIYKSSSSHLKNYKYKEAIESALLLIEEAKKSKNDYYHYYGHNILGGSYNDLNDTLRAKGNYEYALVYAQNTQIDTLILGAYNNLGNIYSEDRNTTQIGIDYYNLVINLATRLGKTDNIFTPVVNIAWTYLDNQQYKQAWPYLEQAWTLFGDKKDNLSRSQLATLTGRYYMGINQPDKAKPFFQEAIKLVESDSLILPASVVYDNYSKLLYSEGNFEEAFLAQEKFMDFNSQIFEQERIQQIEATNIKFDVSEYQKNLEIARNEQIFKDEVIEKSRETMLIMVISSIGLLIILLALIRIMISRRNLIKELSNKNEQLIQAKDKAERLSLLKTRFFSTISHELRTPLYGVIGLTSILLEDKSLKDHETDLKSLKFSADYLLALINDVLQMNKMESNLVKLEYLPLNLQELLVSIVKSFEFTRLQNKNNIHLCIDPAIPFNLMGDPVRLSQILMNLVGNAMKFTERGNIWIQADLLRSNSGSATILFKIKDDGLGIPLNKQKIIFEEFSQLKSANYNYQGTGLGLPIVKKLLVLFESEIKLESEEGVGSIFNFEIEFNKDLNFQIETLQNVKEIDANLSVSGIQEISILIVDDNRINQVVTKRILEQKGFICDICDNGTDAVEKVKNLTFDLVLMDVNMPGISGLDATKQIRAFNSFIPIVALTAVEIEEIRDEIIQAGMNDIIVKPYDTSVFYQVIYRNIPAELINK